MDKFIAIRREDKNEWERRSPLTPADVAELREQYGIKTIVQPSKIRVFDDEEYVAAGAEIDEDLSRASVILGVKEIPSTFFEDGKTYVFFSHTIKGQSYNMKMLASMMEKGTNLIDYERILDDNGRRLIFFGKYAGLAGMLETLRAFGIKMKERGLYTPFEKLKQPYEYESLEAAKEAVRMVGEEIDQNGLPYEVTPLVVGFAGYGNVSIGAQEIFDLLPFKTVSPDMLEANFENYSTDNHTLYKVVFKEEDMVKHAEGGMFDKQEYFEHPERYKSKFTDYASMLRILVNCIYWTEKYPRLVTREFLINETYLRSNPAMSVIGDISIDINGAVEISHKATKPSEPCYTWFPKEDAYEDGVKRLGVTVMAVDNLPCEFSREASEEFSSILKGYINEIVNADFEKDVSDINLSDPIKKSLILHKGKLTGDYEYISEFIKK